MLIKQFDISDLRFEISNVVISNFNAKFQIKKYKSATQRKLNAYSIAGSINIFKNYPHNYYKK